MLQHQLPASRCVARGGRSSIARASNIAPHATGGSRITAHDLNLLQEAARISGLSAGLTAPHPNAGCILVGADGKQLATAYQRASGSTSAEVQAVQAAKRSGAAPTTAYLNLEPGDCHGEPAAVSALLGAHVERVVVGMRHPLAHHRGMAVAALRSAGVTVDVLGEAPAAASPELLSATQAAVWGANEALMHRAARRRPLSTLKYAMTLDGKIATQFGHSAWVTSPPARALVFDARARSDAVIVGGNTVRRDNPRLTTRRESGHMPVRIVMSRSLDLPEDAALWDVSVAPTIVATQRGARTSFQAKLRARGVEVVEFDFLTPESVADYCYARGFLQCFWECGGILAAPCISGAVAHKLMAFIAPKVIGGARAPTPVGELGFVEMTQAVDICEFQWRQVGPDLMMVGYLPASGGLAALAAELDGEPSPTGVAANVAASVAAAAAGPVATPTAPAGGSGSGAAGSGPAGASGAAGTGPSTSGAGSAPAAASSSGQQQAAIPFYKAWDTWGALSNFTPHAIRLPHFHSAEAGATSNSVSGLGPQPAGAPGTIPAPDPASLAATQREAREWRSVEHYYQAQKFAGSGAGGAAAVVEAIAAAESPEEAARIGRATERCRPDLMTPGWPSIKVYVMAAATRAKFSTHAGPRDTLLATGTRRLAEASPNDYFWGAGYNGRGRNTLGLILEGVRAELRAGAHVGSAAGAAQ